MAGSLIPGKPPELPKADVLKQARCTLLEHEARRIRSQGRGGAELNPVFSSPCD